MKLFEIGKAYCATPAMPGAKQRIVIPIGREGNYIQFAFVDALATVEVVAAETFGREFAMISDDVRVYSTTSECEMPASESAKVLDLIRRSTP